jgi:hypothetical protein
VGAAALPRRARQGGADRRGQPGMRIGGDEPDSGQAAGCQVPQEGQPAGAVFGRSDLQAR